tara:strand:- start:902 stop:2077 length:1176 start_codon:yes stop_codon:yes gene_type:complete
MESNLKIVEWNIDKLISAEYNPRKLSEEQKQKIKDSINRFGLVDPVIVNTNKDRFGIIIGGHQRTKVSREMGFKKMPCVELDLNLDQEKELNVRLNKNTGEFDKELLVEYFDQNDLVDWGFDNDYFEDVVTEIDAPEEDDFNGELPSEPKTVLGDLYELNGHRVHCADSSDSESISKTINKNTIDLLLTDPPYGIGYAGSMSLGTEKFGWKQYDGGWDEKKPESGVLQYLCEISTNQIIWGGNYFTDDLPPTMGWLIWDKGQRGFSLADGEMAWTSFKNALRIKEYARAKANMEEKNHPTQKPQEIMKWCFEYADRHSKIKPTLIFDAYLGSGSTLIASEQLDRKCYGQELDPKYCDVIVKRWVKYMIDNDRKFTVKRNGEDITKETWINE